LAENGNMPRKQARKSQKSNQKAEPSAGGTAVSRARAGRPGPPLNLDEVRDLIALLKENGISEFEFEREGYRIRLRSGSESAGPHFATSLAHGAPAAPLSHAVVAAPPPLPPAAPSLPSHPGASAQTAASEDQGLHIIESPIVGTFYRARSPNAEPFVKTGSQVSPDTVVCIIEAMKLMNEIQAETTGEIVKIYVENGQPVEYGQPLFGVKG
jgi:acetyl-CoA carboxylase biotin carboxyl carrier protein